MWMHSPGQVLALGLLCATLSLGLLAQSTSLREATDRAVAQSKLTSAGSSPFHLRAKIAETDNPDSDLTANVEMFWFSPEKWRQTVTSPDFSQTLIVNGKNISERNTGDYYPVWLHQLVTAMSDPLPMLVAGTVEDVRLTLPSGLEEWTSCAQSHSMFGIPPAENSVFYAYCFAGSEALLESVVSPGYAIEFAKYESFMGKRVARVLTTEPEPGTTIEARITELNALANEDPALFAVPQATPSEERIRTVTLPEAELMKLSVQAPPIAWPPVRSGKTAGVLSLYVSLDKTGRVRETFPLNSASADMEDSARQQVQKWQFKPMTSNGAPVQVESVLTFAFNTKIDNPIPILDDAEARELVYHAVEPQIPRGVAIPRISFTVRASVGLDGSVQGVENPFDVSPDLMQAASSALKNWHFRPYLRNGQSDIFKADITFHLK
jgi:outer membrane biosynthesis protein TonB